MRHRWLWGAFGAGALALVAFLAWVSRDLLDARAEARFQTHLRLALSRMDQRFSLDLATEARRPLTDYRAVRALEEDAYTRGMQKIEPREILTPSPLLEGTPDYAKIHFEVATDGVFHSPQIPTGAARDLLVQDERQQKRIEANCALLDEVATAVDPKAMLPQVEEAEKKTKEQAPWAKAAKSAATPTSTIGTLEPVWQGERLFFIRRVTLEGQDALQGFLADWPRIRRTLLDEVRDILPDADLLPPAPHHSDTRLITLPACLVASRPAAGLLAWTSTHALLATLWPVAWLAIALVGVALKRSIDFGERQRRFAGLVTHELRSPLTTFRLYSDLLAEGLVTDDEKRTTYHKTLQRESDLMARMVENVIAHARLESGRLRLHPEAVALEALMGRLEPDLQRIAAKGGQPLVVEVRGSGGLTTDADAVRQILANLVENACKYGRSERPIEVAADAGGDRVTITVRDHGDGVPKDVVRRIFQPFERGHRDETDPTRGLGLGLALSRGLARDLGGTLTHEAPPGGGALFRLSLPGRY